VIVSHTHRVIFIANPKTGSSSVEAALSGMSEEPELDFLAREGFYTRHHAPAYIVRERLGTKVWDAYFKFAFVRNPWDWFVSQHFYNLQKRSGAHDTRASLPEDAITSTYDFLRTYRGAEWADSACQNAFVCDARGDVLVDFLGRFEHFERDFTTALSMAGGLDANLPHVNSSAHGYFKDYYTPATVEMIRAMYSRDVSLFGYAY
jgi:hypothetical protein